MAELKTRIKLKYAPYSEWQSSTLTLLKGEIAVCEIPTANTHNGTVKDGEGNSEIQTIPTVLFKVGDGTKTFSQLPWASAKAADVYDWAKASDVELVETTGTGGKKERKLTFVGTNKTVTLDYITPAEVEAITNGIAQDLAEHVGRTDNPHTVTKAQVGLGQVDNKSTATIKSEFTGSIAENNDGFVTGGAVHAAIAAASSSASGAAGEIAEDLAKHLADFDNPHKVNKTQVGLGNVENKSTATIKSEFTGSVAENNEGFVTGGAVHTQIIGAKGYTDTEVKKVSDAADGIAEDLAEHVGRTDNPHVVTKTQVGLGKVDNMSVAEIKESFTGYVDENDEGFVTGGLVYQVFETANMNAAGFVDTLAEGAVKTNTEAIAQLRQDLTDEAKDRSDADEKLDERLIKIEAFFGETADDANKGFEHLNTALDTLVEIQDYLQGDGTAAGSVIGRIAAAEEDIDNLEKVVGTNGSLTQAFAQAQTDISNLQAVTREYTGEKAIKNDVKAAKDAAANAQADADRANVAVFGTADGTATASGLTSKVTALENTINGTGASDTGLVGDVAQNAEDIAGIKGDYVHVAADNRLYYGNSTAGYIVFDCGGASE